MTAKSEIVPFIFPNTQRSWVPTLGASAKDQQLINGVYQVQGSGLLGSKTVYCGKRAGSSTGSAIGTTSGEAIVLKNYSNQSYNYVGATSGVYHLYGSTGTDLGTLSDTVREIDNHIVAEAVIGSTTVFAFTDVDTIGYYLFSDASTTNFPTFTGDTHTNTVIDNIASTTGIYVGQILSGSGIVAGTRVASITSATAITVDTATTATASGVTITKEAVAKITSANLPPIQTIESIDGFFYALSVSTNRVYESKRNDPSIWFSDRYISPDYSGDGARFLFKIGNVLGVAGNGGTVEYFRIGQTTTGTSLIKVTELNTLGLTMQNAPVSVMGRKFFIGQPGNAGTIPDTILGLYEITAPGQYQKISTDIYDPIIKSIFNAGAGDTTLGTALIGGKAFLTISNSGTDTFLVYDPVTNEFNYFIIGTGIVSSFRSRFTRVGSASSFNWASGNTWTDSGGAFTLTAQTELKYLNGGLGFTVNRVDLFADTEASGTATLEVSKDDYTTWTTVGTFDMTKSRKAIFNVGYADANMAFRVTHSANTNFRAQALIVHYTPATT